MVIVVEAAGDDCVVVVGDATGATASQRFVRNFEHLVVVACVHVHHVVIHCLFAPVARSLRVWHPELLHGLLVGVGNARAGFFYG